MLEKSAKIYNVVQAIAAALCMYSFFSRNHPGWLPFVSVIFLAVSVLTSSILNLVVLSTKDADIRGKILRGYLDLRAFRVEATSTIPRWIALPHGCSVKLYADLVNRNDISARFYAEKTSLELRVGSKRFYGTWERVIPGQQAIKEHNKETLNDIFDLLHPDDALQQGIPWAGYIGFTIENFDRALLHDRTALIANVKVRIHDTLGGVHMIKGDKIRIAIEEVCLPSEFAA
jgi:hypothetical protein